MLSCDVPVAWSVSQNPENNRGSAPSLPVCRFITVIDLNDCLFVGCAWYMLASLDAMEARQDGMMKIFMTGLIAATRLLCMKQHGRNEKGN